MKVTIEPHPPEVIDVDPEIIRVMKERLAFKFAPGDVIYNNKSGTTLVVKESMITTEGRFYQLSVGNLMYEANQIEYSWSLK